MDTKELYTTLEQKLFTANAALFEMKAFRPQMLMTSYYYFLILFLFFIVFIFILFIHLLFIFYYLIYLIFFSDDDALKYVSLVYVNQTLNTSYECSSVFSGINVDPSQYPLVGNLTHPVTTITGLLLFFLIIFILLFILFFIFYFLFYFILKELLKDTILIKS